MDRIRWVIAEWLLRKALRICPSDRRGLELEDRLQEWW